MKPAKPIVIGGFYRSGTTLVRRILDSHSHIHCGPEVKFFKDFFGDYINDPLAHVRLFSTARSYGLPDTQLLSIFGAAFIAFHEEAARLSGKERWADKNPENVLYLREWDAILPNGFLFVHVVRNPLDALASLVEIGFEKAVPIEFENKVYLYERFRKAGDAYCSTNPATSIEIDYDDLVNSPEDAVMTLAEHLGEPFEAQMLVSLNAPERRGGIEDPKSSKHAVVHSRSVGRGRAELADSEIELVERHLSTYLS
ncbi:sulfotransferase family protein [Mesorhizobium humile]|uniref:Sulfotransferase n=1 Tax=Mesorhizobium humile TaxID=3072313 RepID=A0ABU4YDG9_9HYPH|nr:MULTISPECIES: sulfotransferase [unclassified Mesorhizobium]MDX8459211.1 sulfotransferase [Mesorhizobium sp. VK2D]MDX8484994.1 sulfotransferase [Mesorhizobium sp. VK2B]